MSSMQCIGSGTTDSGKLLKPFDSVFDKVPDLPGMKVVFSDGAAEQVAAAENLISSQLPRACRALLWRRLRPFAVHKVCIIRAR